MDPTTFIISITLSLIYNIGIESLLHNYIDRTASVSQYFGAYGPSRSENIADDDRISSHIKDKSSNDYSVKTESFVLTAEVFFYMLIHSICGCFLPGYIVFIYVTRMMVATWTFCKVNVQNATNIADMCFSVATYIMKFWRIGNYVINKLNIITRGWLKIKKSAESLSTYSIATVSIISLALFYLVKKWFVPKQYPKPQVKQMDSRGQNMVNLGLMIISFIGWSDFGLWKQLQDWIKATQYANKIFGDGASDLTCSNYNPKKYNSVCRGNTRGEHLCLGCTAEKVAKDPAVLAHATLDFSINSITDDPGRYFYPLVRSLLNNNNEIPTWYTRLPSFLQEQIFESHYAIIGRNESFPRKYRLNHERLLNKEYIFKRDESVGKWIIVSKALAEIEKKLAQTKTNEPTTVKVYDMEHVISDSDSDYESGYRHGSLLSSVPMFTPQHRPQCGSDKEHKTCERKQSTSQDADVTSASLDALEAALEPEYGEAFSHEKDIQTKTCEAIPYIQQLPSFFKPCIFLAAMCLILYGSFYYYRKYQNETKARTAIAEALVKKDAQSTNVLPPVLQNIQVPEPEGFRRAAYDKKHARYDRHGSAPPKNREQEQEISVDKTYIQWKNQKMRAYFCYDINQLADLLEERGVTMRDSTGDTQVARDYQTFRMLLQKKYTPNPAEMSLIQKGTLDLRRYQESDSIDFLPFHKVVKHEPLSKAQYDFIDGMVPASNELPSDNVIVPDWKWYESWNRYEWDNQTRMYRHLSDMPVITVESNPKQILARAVQEISQQELTLSKPSTTTPEQYAMNSKLLDDLIQVQQNEELAKKHKVSFNKVSIAQPESNVSTIESDVCPYGVKCTTIGCPKLGHKSPKPEALLGKVKLPHYEHLIKVDTDNDYGMYWRDKTERYGNCVFTKLGFVTQYHCFFEDPETRKQPIPIHELTVYIAGKHIPIKEFERFPNILGWDNQELPEEFQDQVYFKLQDHFEHTKNLAQAKARIPKDGDTAMIVSVLPILPDGIKRTRNEIVVIEKGEHAGYFSFQSNNYDGDSGSPVYCTQTGNLLGTYYGRVTTKKNGMIPINQKFISNINGGQTLQLSKKFQPTL